jgi:hypothetical protein
MAEEKVYSSDPISNEFFRRLDEHIALGNIKVAPSAPTPPGIRPAPPKAQPANDATECVEPPLSTRLIQAFGWLCLSRFVFMAFAWLLLKFFSNQNFVDAVAFGLTATIMFPLIIRTVFPYFDAELASYLTRRLIIPAVLTPIICHNITLPVELGWKIAKICAIFVAIAYAEYGLFCLIFSVPFGLLWILVASIFHGRR